MDLSKLVAISGKPGIFKMLNNKNNGMIAENLENGKKGFFSTRSYQFTPLESIQIYTTDEEGGAALKDVFVKMLEGDTPPDVKSSKDELRAYLTKILPNHDQEQVHNSDIKKLIKWFTFLNERDLLTLEDEEENKTDEEE